MLIKPDAEIMQGHLSGQADLKAIQGMRALAIEAKEMLKAAVNGLHDLTEAGPPAPPGLRPGMTAVALGRTDDLSAIDRLPVLMPVLTLKALIGDIRSLGGGTDAGHARVGAGAQGQEGLGQGLVFGAG